MPTRTGYTRSPRTTTGALILLTRDIIGVVPYITLFQYNPESINRSFNIESPFEYNAKADANLYLPTGRATPPGESYSFKLELDATDDLELGRPLTIGAGVSDRIAALERTIFPTHGLLGDIAALGGTAEIPTVPIVLLVLGPQRVVPVWVSSLSITETAHNPALMPIHAEVDIAFQVITAQELSGSIGLDTAIARVVYRIYRNASNALSLAHAASVVADTLDNVGVI
jgi:hypothetical protein